MNRLYTSLVTYNPGEGKVTNFTRLDPKLNNYSARADKAFHVMDEYADHTTEIILGKSIPGDFYQLSQSRYGDYIREDGSTVSRFINKDRLLAAIARFLKEKNIPFDHYN